MFKKSLVVLGLSICLAGPSAAAGDGAAEAAATPAERMAPLEWMVGEWEGEAWVQRGPGERQTIRQREWVEWRAGGEVLLIRGEGRETEPDGVERVVHEAVATVAWDPRRQGYSMWTYAVGRGVGEPRVEVEDGRFVWTLTSPEALVRFSIRLDEDERWVESGEMSPDGGATWFPFFGMTLSRR